MGKIGELASELENGKSKFKFDDFWFIFPRRKGSNPKTLARTKWDSALKNGATAEQIIDAAKSYGDELRSRNQYGTEFVCMAATWLNQKRYLDYEPDPSSKARQAKIDADMAAKGWQWDGIRWVKKDIKKAAPDEGAADSVDM